MWPRVHGQAKRGKKKGRYEEAGVTVSKRDQVVQALVAFSPTVWSVQVNLTSALTIADGRGSFQRSTRASESARHVIVFMHNAKFFVYCKCESEVKTLTKSQSVPAGKRIARQAQSIFQSGSPVLRSKTYLAVVLVYSQDAVVRHLLGGEGCKSEVHLLASINRAVGVLVF